MKHLFDGETCQPCRFALIGRGSLKRRPSRAVSEREGCDTVQRVQLLGFGVTMVLVLVTGLRAGFKHSMEVNLITVAPLTLTTIRIRLVRTASAAGNHIVLYVFIVQTCPLFQE